MMCGWDRQELLKEVVLILGKYPAPCSMAGAVAERLTGKHRDLQRITVPYARLLGVHEERADDMVTDI